MGSNIRKSSRHLYLSKSRHLILRARFVSLEYALEQYKEIKQKPKWKKKTYFSLTYYV